ncbi:MAG: hypothetical protein MZV49_19985 [Rhodopseudomonas palustris]|nr:hypothetical protein [Rhodopseudomonas palustris]
MMLSESQERMLMVLKPEKERARRGRSSRSGGSTSRSSATPPTTKRFVRQARRRGDGRPADRGARRRGAGLRPAVDSTRRSRR